MTHHRTLAAAAILVTSLLATGPAQAQDDECVELPSGTATINGTVKAQENAAAVFASVTATAQIPGFSGGIFSGFAALGGAFSIEVAAPATYLVAAAPVDFVHAPELYNGALTAAAATEISVTPGQVVNNIDFTVVVGTSVSGTVTAASGGAPIEGVSVLATALGDLPHTAFAQTDASGDYTLAGLAATDYQLIFFPAPASGDFLTEYYDDNATAPGDPVSVPGGGLTGIDAALALGGRIEGTVTGPGATPLDGIGVAAITTSGYLFGGDTTDASGDYSLLVPAGSSKVFFNGEGGLVGEYYNNKPDLASADGVAVTSGNTTANIDAQLATGGRIAGRVTDASTGDGIASATVTAYSSTGTFVAIAITESNGDYEVDGNLPTGQYKVGFSGPPRELDGSPGYADAFYSNKGSLGNATLVSVTAPNTTPNINQELTPCDEVTGSTTTTTVSVTTTTLDGASECGDPVALTAGLVSTGVGNTVSATDGLFVLRSGVGLEVCALCVCDVNDSGGVSATDALAVLRAAVGQPVTLQCPPCS